MVDAVADSIRSYLAMIIVDSAHLSIASHRITLIKTLFRQKIKPAAPTENSSTCAVIAGMSNNCNNILPLNLSANNYSVNNIRECFDDLQSFIIHMGNKRCGIGGGGGVPYDANATNDASTSVNKLEQQRKETLLECGCPLCGKRLDNADTLLVHFADHYLGMRLRCAFLASSISFVIDMTSN